MKSLFTVDFANNAITASKTTLKKASIPNSPEYKELMKLMKKHPSLTIAEKEIKKAVGKETYEGLNKAFIEKYISIKSNAKELNEQYAKATEMGKFPLVRKWFLDTFKDDTESFKVSEAKKTIATAKVRRVKATVQLASAKQADEAAA